MPQSAAFIVNDRTVIEITQFCLDFRQGNALGVAPRKQSAPTGSFNSVLTLGVGSVCRRKDLQLVNASPSHIPTEVYLDFLGRTIQIHWDYHAIFMVGIWFVIVPLCIVTIRYGKPKPTFYGIREEISLTNIAWWWFSVHKFGFYFAIGLSLAGAAVALTVSRGFSGSVHSIFAMMTIILACLQILSAWLRGTHGGRYYFKADPDNPATWHGDHYDMTPRRRLFESYHKTAGYFTGFSAVGTVSSGLMQYRMPALAGFVVTMALVTLVLCVVLEHQGLRYDGYRAAFGNDPEHPYNKLRKDL